METNQYSVRTHIVLDTHLVSTGLELTGMKTRRELVDHALRELVRHERRKKLLGLKGKVQWQGDLDELRQAHADDD